MMRARKKDRKAKPTPIEVVGGDESTFNLTA